MENTRKAGLSQAALASLLIAAGTIMVSITLVRLIIADSDPLDSLRTPMALFGGLIIGYLLGKAKDYSEINAKTFTIGLMLGLIPILIAMFDYYSIRH